MADGVPTVTLKAGPGFEVPWIVLSGSVGEMRAQLVDVFGLDDEFVGGCGSFAGLVVKCAGVFQGLYSLEGLSSSPRGGKAAVRSSKAPKPVGGTNTPTPTPEAVRNDSVASGEGSGGSDMVGFVEGLIRGCGEAADLAAVFQEHADLIRGTGVLVQAFREKRAKFVQS